MAFNNTNMLRIAQIGAMTRPEFRNMPTLDLGGAVDNFFNARDVADKRAQRQAYIDALTEQHPEDAARIAADPYAYAAMLDENKKAERDQQYKLDYLAKQNANAMGLAAYQNNLRNIAAKEEKAQRAAQLDEALASGLISQDQYNMAKQRELLGDIVKGFDGGFGTTPIGNALTITSNPSKFTDEQINWARNYLKNGDVNYAYDQAYSKTAGSQKAKNLAQLEEKSSSFEANLPSFTDMTNELIDLADKATYTQAGQLRDALLRQLDLPMTEGGIAREKYKQVVANELIPHLKEMFGGQLSDAERTALLDTLGNPDLSPSEKKAAVSSFIESKQRQMESYRRRTSSNIQSGQKIGGFTIIGVE